MNRLHRSREWKKEKVLEILTAFADESVLSHVDVIKVNINTNVKKYKLTLSLE